MSSGPPTGDWGVRSVGVWDRVGGGVAVTGRVRWFDSDRGIGLLGCDGGDVVVYTTALPAGTTALPIGTRVQFDVETSTRGPVAVDVTVVCYPAPRRPRRSPEAHDHPVGGSDPGSRPNLGGLPPRPPPDPAEASTLARVLRAIADDLDT